MNNKTTLNLKTAPFVIIERSNTPPLDPLDNRTQAVDIGSRVSAPFTEDETTLIRQNIEAYNEKGGRYHWLFGDVAINLDVISGVHLGAGNRSVHILYPGGTRSFPAQNADRHYKEYLRYLDIEDEVRKIKAEIKTLPQASPAPEPFLPVDPVMVRSAAAQKIEEEQERMFQDFLARRIIVDMTEEARAGKYDLLGIRKKLVNEIEAILAGDEKNNPLLLGDPGAGKTALVQQLTLRIVEGTARPELLDTKVYDVNFKAMDTSPYGGDFENKFFSTLHYVTRMNERGDKNIIFADEIHVQLRAGRTTDSGNMMKPTLENPNLRVIGATTFDEFHRHLASDGALERRFDAVSVFAPGRDETLELLEGRRIRLESKSHIVTTPETMAFMYDLAEDLLPNRFQPDKTILIFNKSARIAWDEKSKELKPQHALQAMEAMYNLPEGFLQQSERTRYQTLDDHLARRVFGQDEALSDISGNLKRGRARLSDANKPIGTLLLIGPNSTGRTTAARAIAEHLAGGTKNMIHFDMSTFTNYDAARLRLLGTGSNSRDHRTEGALTGALERKPFSVLFFDHINKADAQVRDMITEIVSKGEAADLSGRKYSMRNTIVIMTSRDHEGITDGLRSTANIIEFKPLSASAHEKILRRESIKLDERVEAEWGMEVAIPPQFITQIANQSGREQWGAKLAATQFEKDITTPLGRWLIDNADLKSSFGAAARRDTLPDAANENQRTLIKITGIGAAFSVNSSAPSPDTPTGVIRLAAHKRKPEGGHKI